MEIFTSRNKKIIKSIFNLEATQQKLSKKSSFNSQENSGSEEEESEEESEESSEEELTYEKMIN